MGRWKAPRPPSSAYITAAGYARLQQELKDLWKRRLDVVAALSAAAAEGDRSENAEYIYRKKELGGLDRRIRYLQNRLPTLMVVREFAARETVFFGAWVEVEHDDGTTHEYRIVGPDEADTHPSYVSMDAPLAKALLKRGVDDSVSITLGENTTSLVISSVRYPSNDT
jgi:transcription elongation factor GreB